MNYLIGIDGGASKTRCVITDFQLNVIHGCTGEPSNFLIRGSKVVSNTILDLIEDCKDNLIIDAKDIGAVVIGTTGAGREKHANELKDEILNTASERGISITSLCVFSDARIALEGAFSGEPGCILIVGTGSIMFGKDADGNIIRIGGLGRFIGDEGSGYSIGRKGLKSVARSFDGRCLPTILKEMAKEKFGISSEEQLITEIYSNNFDIASFAPAVLEGALLDDETCINILEDESEELILHVRAMMPKLNVSPVKLSLIGSLVKNDNIYSTFFLNKLRKYLPEVILQKPEHPPEYGAVLLAKQKLC
ncbi:N-acetylglucosamine kinase [Bacteroidota bacterium]